MRTAAQSVQAGARAVQQCRRGAALEGHHGGFQSELRYHFAMQELPQLLYLVISSSVSPAITHGAHTLPQSPELTEP